MIYNKRKLLNNTVWHLQKVEFPQVCMGTSLPIPLRIHFKLHRDSQCQTEILDILLK